MRQNKALMVELVIGIILAGVGLLTHIDYYSTLIFAMGCGLASGSACQLARSFYWSSPKRRTEYEEKKREAHINAVDERRRYLQMKAAQVSAQAMLVVLLVLAFGLSLFRAEPWVVGMITALFLFMCVTDVVAFRCLEKRM